jgi:CRP-like cAMP-binding protein
VAWNINEPDNEPSQLSTAAQSRLSAAGTHRRWSRGDELIREAESTGNVLLIRRGRVKVSSTSPCGKKVIMAIRGPGDLLGESAAIDGKGRSATVTALTEVDAVSLTQIQFRQILLHTPQIALELLAILVSRLRESTRRRLELGVDDVPTRTAQWLLDAVTHGEPIGHGPGYLVRLTQNDLADAVAASRVSVANALKSFREDEVVLTERAAFHVLDPAKLQTFARRSECGPHN